MYKFTLYLFKYGDKDENCCKTLEINEAERYEEMILTMGMIDVIMNAYLNFIFEYKWCDRKSYIIIGGKGGYVQDGPLYAASFN